MSLDKYWEKRDFKITPEPRGEEVQSSNQLSYFIQRHHARRLHYDFRLELNGTLKAGRYRKVPALIRRTSAWRSMSKTIRCHTALLKATYLPTNTVRDMSCYGTKAVGRR